MGVVAWVQVGGALNAESCGGGRYCRLPCISPLLLAAALPFNETLESLPLPELHQDGRLGLCRPLDLALSDLVCT